MVPHSILTLYSAKPVEYVIAALFLLLFVPFWRYVQGGRPAHARAGARRRRAHLSGWFETPPSLYYHPGHTWARLEADGLLTLGVDDFGHKLVGALTGISLPRPGETLAQGESGWTLLADGIPIDVLSPVDGVVEAVNPAACVPGRAIADAYGNGWLVKVRPTRLAANLKSLLTGAFAETWTEVTADRLRARLRPAMGTVYEDGGVPVDGIAPALQPDDWEDLAREFLLTTPAR
jgi:glycine cleavage system H protein